MFIKKKKFPGKTFSKKNKLFKNQKNLKLFNLKIMMKKTFLGKTPNFFRDLNIDNPTKTTSIL